MKNAEFELIKKWGKFRRMLEILDSIDFDDTDLGPTRGYIEIAYDAIKFNEFFLLEKILRGVEDLID